MKDGFRWMGMDGYVIFIHTCILAHLYADFVKFGDVDFFNMLIYSHGDGGQIEKKYTDRQNSSLRFTIQG